MDEDAWAGSTTRQRARCPALCVVKTEHGACVLAFLICTSQTHALRQRPESDATRHVPDTTRSLLRPPPKPSGTVEVFSSNGSTTATVLRGAAPRSTAAAVSALFHHTAALRVVCRELRTDANALYSAANSTATPRSWLANLYCRRDEPAAATAILSWCCRARLSAGSQHGARIILRKDARSNFTPPEYGRTSRYGDFAQQTISQGHISSRVMHELRADGPSAAATRYDCCLRGECHRQRRQCGVIGRSFLTVDEANRNAPVDEELPQSLSNAAYQERDGLAQPLW